MRPFLDGLTKQAIRRSLSAVVVISVMVCPPLASSAATDNIVSNTPGGNGSLANANQDTYFGASAGNNSDILGNFGNVGLGDSAGISVTGLANTGVGFNSGVSVSGAGNNSYGNSSGQHVTGNDNESFGYISGLSVTGGQNTAGRLPKRSVDLR